VKLQWALLDFRVMVLLNFLPVFKLVVTEFQAVDLKESGVLLCTYGKENYPGILIW
jgi:hypothetical protein